MSHFSQEGGDERRAEGGHTESSPSGLGSGDSVHERLKPWDTACSTVSRRTQSFSRMRTSFDKGLPIILSIESKPRKRGRQRTQIIVPTATITTRNALALKTHLSFEGWMKMKGN